MFVIPCANPNQRLYVAASDEIDPAQHAAETVVRINRGGGLKKDVIEEDGLGPLGIRAQDFSKIHPLTERIRDLFLVHDAVVVCCKSGRCRSVLIAIVYLYRFRGYQLAAAEQYVLQLSHEAALHPNTVTALAEYRRQHNLT